MASFSTKSNVVVIGGGIFGCSIAYHFTRNHPGKKIIVIERNDICSAATSRAAALLTIVRAKTPLIPLTLATFQAIREMEEQLGESLHLRKVGMMHVAASDKAVDDLGQLMQIALQFGQPAEYLSANEARRFCPWLNTKDVQRIGFMCNESFCDPYLLGTFYARCAKQQGAEFIRDCSVTSLLMENGLVQGVQTTLGAVVADVVIDAAGAWAPVLAAQAGTGIPMAPVRSQYWITEKANIFPESMPMVLLPDAQAYTRPEGGALLFGLREKQSKYAAPNQLPDNISDFVFSEDNGMNDLLENGDRLAAFFPGFHEMGIKHYIAGFSGYTPDGQPVLGKVPQAPHFLLASGCCGAGIALSGGVGLALAELAAGNEPGFDLSAFDVSRFGQIDPFSADWLEKCARARSIKLSG